MGALTKAIKRRLGGLNEAVADEELIRETAATSSETASMINKAEKATKEFAKDKELGEALNISAEAEKWATPDQLKDAGYSDKTVEGYKTIRQMEDEIYTHDNNRAIESIKEGGYGFNKRAGRIEKTIDNSFLESDGFSKAVIEMPNGKVLTSRDIGGSNLRKYLDDNGMELRRIHPLSRTLDDLDYNFSVVSKTDALGDLPNFVLPYAPGGRRIYDRRNWLLKAPRVFNKNGSLYRTTDKTFFADFDYNKLKVYSDEMNRALDALEVYRKNKDDIDIAQAMLDQEDFSHFEFTNIADVDQWAKKNNLDPRYKSQVVRMDEKIITKDLADDIDDFGETDSALASLYKDQAARWRRRTKLLRNPDGKPAAQVDIKNRMMNTVSRLAYSEQLRPLYKRWGDTFKEQYGQYIDTDKTPFDINGTSGETLLRYGKLREAKSLSSDIDKENLSKAAAMQRQFRVITNTPTEGDKRVHSFMKALTEKTFPKEYWNNPVLDKLANSDPLKFIQGKSFQLTLGVFNPKQFFIQGPGMIINAAGISPIQITKSILAAPLTIMGAGWKGSRKYINYFSRILGMKPKELEEMWEFMDRRGTINILSQNASLTPEYGSVTKGIDMVFMNSSNNLASIIIDAAAYMSTKGQGFKSFVREADKLGLYQQRWYVGSIQTGMGRYFNQWLNYQVRVLEALAGHSLDTKEKVGLMLGQLAAWGVSGAIAKDSATNVYNFLVDKAGLTEDQAQIATDGVITTAAAHAGYDIREGLDFFAVAERIAGLVNYSQDSFGQVPDIPMFNAFSQVGAMYKVIRDLVSPSTSAIDEYNFYRILATTPYMLPVGKDYGRFILARDFQVFLDKYGDKVKDDANMQDAYVYLMGFQPLEQRAINDARAYNKAEKELVEDMYNTVLKPLDDKLNTYYRTKHYPDVDRDDNKVFQMVYDRQEAHKAFLSWTRRNHPDYINLATNLANRTRKAGALVKFKEDTATAETIRVLYNRLKGDK